MMRRQREKIGLNPELPRVSSEAIIKLHKQAIENRSLSRKHYKEIRDENPIYREWMLGSSLTARRVVNDAPSIGINAAEYKTFISDLRNQQILLYRMLKAQAIISKQVSEN